MTNIMATNKSPPPVKKLGQKSSERLGKKTSLNKNVRQTELNRITQENEALLKRLQES